MIKKQTDSLLKGLKSVKKILSLNNTLNVEEDDAYKVGRCPKCNKIVLEGDGVYGCIGRLSNKCDYMMPTMLDGKKISFEEILKLEKYQKMIESGFLDNNTDLSNASENNKNQSVVDEKEVKTTHKTLGICPKCGGDVISNDSKYSCTKCDYKLNGSFSRTKIAPSVVETLLKGEYTDCMQFTKKNGETYESRLMLDDKNYDYARVPYKKPVSTNKNVDKSFKVKKEKTNKEVKNHTVLNKECSTNSTNRKSLGKCPICKKDIIAGKSAFGCIGLTKKECTFKIPFKFDNISIDSKDIIELLRGKTISKKEINGEEVFLKIDRDGILERVPF